MMNDLEFNFGDVSLLQIYISKPIASYYLQKPCINDFFGRKKEK